MESEAVNQLGCVPRNVGEQLKNDSLLSSMMGGADVFERGATGDSGQQASQCMLYDARFKIGRLVEWSDGLDIASPIQMGRADKTPPLRPQIMGFAQQVGQRKSQIESRLSEMNDLEIEQHQPVGMDEDVLGTVVAVNQAISMLPGFADQSV